MIDFRSLGNKKILLAEDVAFNQYIAKQMLESWGFDVTVANNGLEVLALAEKSFFDCILMDIQMPEMGGIEAAQLIRKLDDKVKANVPIIAVTANALKGDQEKYLAAGMSDYLPKPFEEPQLFAVIAKNLSRKKDDFLSGKKIDEPAVENINHAKNGDGKMYDLTMIKSVSGGDDEFIKKMVVLFIETVPQNVQELKNNLQNANWEQVSKDAHKLKSTVDSMGIKSLKTIIRTVEANAKQKILLEEIPSLINKIDNDINECVRQLRKEFLQNHSVSSTK